MKYIYYREDGTHEILEREKPMEYKELSELVGGMIEFSESFEDARGSAVCLNEEGLYIGKPNPFLTPLHQPSFNGNILHGKNVETPRSGREFHGFDDDAEVAKHLLLTKHLHPKLFMKDELFTIISIGGFMANTTKGEVKAVGQSMDGGNPVFKEAKKGARKMFGLRNLKEPDVLIFAGKYDDLPFVIDGDMPVVASNGMTSRIIRGNALINLHGDPDTIRTWIKEKNLNPWFTAYDRVNHIAEDRETETLLFMDRFASCQLVADRQTAQHKREGRNIQAGVGHQIA